MVKASLIDSDSVTARPKDPSVISVKKQLLYEEDLHPAKVLLDYDELLNVEAALGGGVAESNSHLLEELCGTVDLVGNRLEIQRKMRS